MKHKKNGLTACMWKMRKKIEIHNSENTHLRILENNFKIQMKGIWCRLQAKKILTS
jgi:hypothetical protein